MAKSIKKNKIEHQEIKKDNLKVSLSIVQEPAIWKKIWMGSLIISMITMILSSFYFGLSGDEAYANGMGKAAWKFITTFGQDKTIFNLPDAINRDGVLTYYGNIFDIMCIWLNAISPFDEFTTRHIFNAFIGFVGIYYASKIAKFYWGYRPAILVIWMMYFFPFFFGHAMNNPKDVPMASFYIMGIYYLLMFFEHYPNLEFKDYFLLILAIVLTIDVRVAGLLLIAFMFILVILNFKTIAILAQSKGWFKTLLPVIIVSISSYLLCSIFWPYAALDPINNPLNALEFLSNFKVPMPALWEGESMVSKEVEGASVNVLPTDYLVQSIKITSPYVFLIGLIVSLVLFVVKFKQMKHSRTYIFLLFVSIFPLFYIMYKGSNVYHLWRHVLFIFPSMAILASLSYFWIGEFLFKSKKYGYIGFVLFGLLLLEPITFYAKNFPNIMCYYNSMVGGVEGAYGNYESDYYYNSMKPCVDEIKKIAMANPKDTITVASNAIHLMKEYLPSSQFPNVKNEYVRYYEKNLRPWDYAIFHIALIPLDEINEEKWIGYNNPIFMNKIQGKPLCALYKRPSKDDINMFKTLGVSTIQDLQKLNLGLFTPEVLRQAQTFGTSYLKQDPKNPMIIQMVKYLQPIAQNP